MTTAILSAIAEEQTGLAELLANAQSVQIAGRTFRTGTLYGKPVVLALSGIGKVAAANTASLLCDRFAATAVVFTGVAGGIDPGVEIGDVVVGQQYLQHDMNAEPLFPRWQIPLYGRSAFEADAALHAKALVAAQLALTATSPTARLHSGLLLSGDQFIHSDTLRSRLLQEHPKALAAEMEGAAVAQVCADFCVPFVAVRQISDAAGNTAAIDFNHFIQTRIAPFAQAFMSGLLYQ